MSSPGVSVSSDADGGDGGSDGGGMPSMGDLSQMMPGMAGAGGRSSVAMPPKRVDRDKLRKMRYNNSHL